MTTTPIRSAGRARVLLGALALLAGPAALAAQHEEHGAHAPVHRQESTTTGAAELLGRR